MNLLGNYITYRSSTELTVAEILRRYWADYRQQHRVTAEQARVVENRGGSGVFVQPDAGE